MDSVKVAIQDNILPYLQVINDGDDLAGGSKLWEAM